MRTEQLSQAQQVVLGEHLADANLLDLATTLYGLFARLENGRLKGSMDMNNVFLMITALPLAVEDNPVWGRLRAVLLPGILTRITAWQANQGRRPGFELEPYLFCEVLPVAVLLLHGPQRMMRFLAYVMTRGEG